MRVKATFLLLFLTFSLIDSSYAWFIYRQPEFKGKVIDSKTKEPIEGATVKIIYLQRIFTAVQVATAYLDEKETVTDKNGEFYFTPYEKVSLNPRAWLGGDVSGYIECCEIDKTGYFKHSAIGVWGGKDIWKEYVYVFELRPLKE